MFQILRAVFRVLGTEIQQKPRTLDVMLQRLRNTSAGFLDALFMVELLCRAFLSYRCGLDWGMERLPALCNKK